MAGSSLPQRTGNAPAPFVISCARREAQSVACDGCVQSPVLFTDVRVKQGMFVFVFHKIFVPPPVPVRVAPGPRLRWPSQRGR